MDNNTNRLNKSITREGYPVTGYPYFGDYEPSHQDSIERECFQPMSSLTPTTPSEIEVACSEMSKEHVIFPTFSSELQKTDEEMKAEFEQKYDELGLKRMAKDEWVAMRLNLERKLRGGLLHRVKRAAAVLGQGLFDIQQKNMKGVTLRAPYHLEAILPQHPMGDKLERLFNRWKNDADSTSFHEWLQRNAPEMISGPGVAYFTDSDRRSTALNVSREGLFMKKGEPYDTAAEKVCSGTDKETKTIKYTQGKAMYVVGPDGIFHASSQVVYERHHSSLYSGGAVIGAGECKIEGGQLTMLSNKSGHYKPTKENMLDVLKVLRAQGVSLSNVKLRMIQSDGRRYDYSSAERFLDSNGQCIPNKVMGKISSIKFKEQISADGSVKHSINVRGPIVFDALRICRNGGWDPAQVRLKVVVSDHKHQFIYNSAKDREEDWCPSVVKYGDHLVLKVIPDEEKRSCVKRLVFDEGTTQEQINEVIRSLQSEWLDLSRAEYQIGEFGTVLTVSQFLDEERSRALKESVQSEGIQTNLSEKQPPIGRGIEEHEEGYPDISLNDE